jgi:hypothetical protein
VQIGERVLLGGGAVVLGRLVEDLDQRPVQPADLHGRDGRHLAVGAQPGIVEDLVGVEAAEPHDERLVEQQRLELLGAVVDQRLGERRPRHRRRHRVEAQLRELGCLFEQQVGGDHERLGGALGVGHAELAALGEREDDLRVLGRLVLGGGAQQLA